MPTTDLIYRYLGIDAGAGAQMERMGAKTAALGRTSNTTLASVKRLAVGVGVAGGVIGVYAVKQAAQFQTAMTRVETQANATHAQVQKLSAGVLSMASAVATSPTALAGAAFHIASVGQKSLTTAQQLGVLKIAAEGAKVGGADLTDVTNALAASIVSNIKGVKNYTQVMGVLNSTVGAGDMTMQNLADALGTGVLAAAKVAGLSIKDVGSALAVFGDNAIRGSTAGQRLSRVIMLMQAPSSSAVKALNLIGLTQTSLASDMRKPNGLVTALADLQEHLKASGLTAVQQGQVIAEAFGRSRGAVNVELLLKEFDRLTNKQKILTQGGHSFAASWAGYTKTFGAAFDRMRSAVEVLMIKIGTGLMPAVTKFVNYTTQHIVPAITSVVHWMERNSGLVKTLAKLLLVSVVAWKAYTIWTKAAAVATKLFGLSAVTSAGETMGIVASLRAATTAGYGWLALGAKLAMAPVALVSTQSDMRVGASSSQQTKWMDAYYQGLLKQKDGVQKLEVAYAHLNDLINRTTGANRAGWMQDQTYVAGLLKEQGVALSTANAFSKLANAIGLAGQALVAFQNAQGYGGGANSPFRDPGHPGYQAPAKHGSKKFTLPGGPGSQITIPGAGGSAKHAAAVLHITAQNLAKALATGLVKGWQGYALTVRESLSTGTQHLLEQLGKQFEAIQKRMTTLVENAKTKLHDALTNERSYVQQMMSDAGLGNVPTVDSGYTGQTTRLTNIGAFLGSQAKNYALFDRLLRRLGHSGLSKSLVSQIAQMGPTQGIQYAQQILANPGQIAQINAYQKQIARSAKAIGQDQYGSQIAADRKNLRRQTELQERMTRILERLARETGQEVAKNLGPLLAKGLSGKGTGLTPQEVREIEKALHRHHRQLAK